jgi:HEAT repeat protein/cyclophilin family peptidyl-prolyl cis-trans isomerase
VPEVRDLPLLPLLVAALLLSGGCALGPRAGQSAGYALDPPAVEAVAGLLRMQHLGELDPDLLHALADHPSPGVRVRVALAAADLGGDGTRARVRALLLDRDTAVAGAAAFAAGVLRDSAAVPLLADLLVASAQTRRPTVAAEAATALGRIATGDARETLRSILERMHVDPSTPAALAIARDAVLAASAAGGLPPELFARWVHSADAGLRWRAVHALSRLEDPRSIADLAPLVNDPSVLVRGFAVQGLARLPESGEGGAMVPPELLRALEDSARFVRVEATRALGTYGTPAAEAALLRVAEEGRGYEQVLAVEAISRFPGPPTGGTAAALLRLARNPGSHEHVRALAVSAMVERRAWPDALDLRSLAADPAWRVRAAAATMAARVEPPEISVLAGLARDPESRVAVLALEAIAAAPLELARALRPVLLERLLANDPRVRAASLRVLSRTAEPSTLPTLLDAFDRARRDDIPVAALAALDAIAELGARGRQVPERALFTRFPPPEAPAVRRRAIERFGESARAAWGDEFPPSTVTPMFDYREMVHRWIAPEPVERERPRLLVETPDGEIELHLYADLAPLAAEELRRLVASGAFDGAEWAAATPGGALLASVATRDPSRHAGYITSVEPSRQRVGIGSVGLLPASGDDPSLLIALAPLPDLPPGAILFGRVVRGWGVLQEILPGDRIVTVREMTPERTDVD